MNRLLQLNRAISSRTFVRAYSSALDREAYKAAKEEANIATETWKKVSLFFAIPLCIGFGIKAVNDEMHHIEHLKHDPPTFTPYPYLRIRRR
ncbi:Cytochrome c oxidase subunit 6A, partial [Spiromyces aspiralis]